MRLFLLTGLIALPSIGYALDKSAPPEQGGGSTYEQFLKRIDTDKDGVISLSESFYNKNIQHQFKELDADQNGFVNSAEFAKYQSPNSAASGKKAPAQSINYTKQKSISGPESPQQAAALHDEPPTQHMQEVLGETAQGSPGALSGAAQPKPGNNQNDLPETKMMEKAIGNTESANNSSSNSVNYTAQKTPESETADEAKALHDEPPTKHMQEVIGENKQDGTSTSPSSQDKAVQPKPGNNQTDLPKTKAMSDVLEKEQKAEEKL